MPRLLNKLVVLAALAATGPGVFAIWPPSTDKQHQHQQQLQLNATARNNVDASDAFETRQPQAQPESPGYFWRILESSRSFLGYQTQNPLDLQVPGDIESQPSTRTDRDTDDEKENHDSDIAATAKEVVEAAINEALEDVLDAWGDATTEGGMSRKEKSWHLNRIDTALSLYSDSQRTTQPPLPLPQGKTLEQAPSTTQPADSDTQTQPLLAEEENRENKSSAPSRGVMQSVGAAVAGVLWKLNPLTLGWRFRGTAADASPSEAQKQEWFKYVRDHEDKLITANYRNATYRWWLLEKAADVKLDIIRSFLDPADLMRPAEEVEKMNKKHRLIYEQVTLSNLHDWQTCTRSDGTCVTYSRSMMTESWEDKNETIEGCFLRETRRYSRTVSDTMNLQLTKQKRTSKYRWYWFDRMWRPATQYVRNESGRDVHLLIYPGRSGWRAAMQQGYTAVTSLTLGNGRKTEVPLDTTKNNLAVFAVIDTCDYGRACIEAKLMPVKTSRISVIVPHELHGAIDTFEKQLKLYSKQDPTGEANLALQYVQQFSCERLQRATHDDMWRYNAEHTKQLHDVQEATFKQIALRGGAGGMPTVPTENTLGKTAWSLGGGIAGTWWSALVAGAFGEGGKQALLAGLNHVGKAFS